MTLLFVIIVIALGVVLTTGFKSKTGQGSDTYVPEASTSAGVQKESLQLKTLKFKKIEIPKDNACKGNPFNEEPEIIYGSDPAFGGVAQQGGQVKIWVWEDDGKGGSVSDGTKVDAAGLITTPGNRTVADRNGYLWEPSIYTTKLTFPDQPGPYPGDKENGGQPKFPVGIKGVANMRPSGTILNSAPIDPPVNVIVKKTGNEWSFSEFIWDVNSMGLIEPGFYRAQIILHDGDNDLAVNCTTIQIQ